MVKRQEVFTVIEKSKEDYFNQIKNDLNLSDKQRNRFENALKQALDIRKFEIEMYWKRASYFWIFIAAVYGVYAWSLQAQISRQFGGMLPLYSSTLCVIVTIAWHLVNKGSKFWQENWEKQVDFLEDFVYGPLYKTRFSPENEIIYSVSKINFWLSFLALIVSWFIYIREFDKYIFYNNIIDFYVFTIYTFLILIAIFLYNYIEELYESYKTNGREFWQYSLRDMPFFNIPIVIFCAIMIPKIIVVISKAVQIEKGSITLFCTIGFIALFTFLFSISINGYTIKKHRIYQRK